MAGSMFESPCAHSMLRGERGTGTERKRRARDESEGRVAGATGKRRGTAARGAERRRSWASAGIGGVSPYVTGHPVPVLPVPVFPVPVFPEPVFPVPGPEIFTNHSPPTLRHVVAEYENAELESVAKAFEYASANVPALGGSPALGSLFELHP
jgi:hypothetical protein